MKKAAWQRIHSIILPTDLEVFESVYWIRRQAAIPVGSLLEDQIDDQAVEQLWRQT